MRKQNIERKEKTEEVRGMRRREEVSMRREEGRGKSEERGGSRRRENGGVRMVEGRCYFAVHAPILKRKERRRRRE